jgi:hypothetical protein
MDAADRRVGPGNRVAGQPGRCGRLDGQPTRRQLAGGSNADRRSLSRTGSTCIGRRDADRRGFADARGSDVGRRDANGRCFADARGSDVSRRNANGRCFADVRGSDVSRRNADRRGFARGGGFVDGGESARHRPIPT